MPNLAIYIRSLKREDALTSYKWRNNPLIWELTGSKPDIEITKEIELSWIDKILKRKMKNGLPFVSKKRTNTLAMFN